MFFKDIEAMYTAKVAEYLANGYIINAGTMRGSQGEIAKIDLRKDDEVIRILLDTHSTWDGDFVNLVVGRNTCTLIRGNETIWNNKLEIIEEHDFAKAGNDRGDKPCYYVPADENQAIQKKREARWTARNRKLISEMNDRAKQIALKYVKRQPRCSRCTIHNIISFQRRIDNGRNRYTVYVVTNTGKKVTFELK